MNSVKHLKGRESIKSVEVERLFGRFDYHISFVKEQNILILTAPNGYGKTVLLRIIDSLFNRKLQYFWKIAFEKIVFTFQSGKTITIHKGTKDLLGENISENKRIATINSSGFGADNETYQLSPTINSSDVRFLERHLPVDMISYERWHDTIAEEIIGIDELLTRYAQHLPDKIVDSLKLPQWLLEAINSVDAHLVETQRLLHLEVDEDYRGITRRRHLNTSSVVERDAKDLSERIGAVLRRYANESQQLDQTFPHRIISDKRIDVSDEEGIRERLDSLSDRRDELMSVGILGNTISEPIEASNVLQDETIRKFLSIYAEDTAKKLGVFDEIYAKINLFKEIIDEHFVFKTIVIDADTGLQAIDTSTDKPIELSDLSSGEQHELVLIYDLLFKVEDGSIILIDEPELSLHVAWQKRFISDLEKILEIKKLDVIIATHSPQIINEKWELVTELGDVD